MKDIKIFLKKKKKKKAPKRYQNFSEEVKVKRCQYIRNTSRSYLSIEEISI